MEEHEHKIPIVDQLSTTTRVRGIVHSISVENGTARLIFDEELQNLRGLLINDLSGECISLSGSVIQSSVTPGTENQPQPSTSQIMRVAAVDEETGDKFYIEGVAVNFIPKINAVTKIAQYWIEINNSAIKFKTDEILIGNRADMEIQRFLDPSESPIKLDSREYKRRTVHIGKMSLKVIAQEKTAATQRRVSICEDCSTKVIERAEGDFLV